jgi:FAD/FMN-containing dehydrogenase
MRRPHGSAHALTRTGRTLGSVWGVDGGGLSRRAFIGSGAAVVAGLAGCGATARRAATIAAAGPPRAADWAALRRSLAGTLVRPGDAAYASARLVYDLRFDGAAPAAVAFAASPSDVQRVVEFCRSHRLAPIPRCGGHSYAGYSTGPGVVVDVSRMGGVHVSGGIASVGAGTRLVDLYSGVAAAGVLVPGGSCPTVGISGLALGGGVGVLGRKYGLTSDAMRAVTIVTADSRVIDAHASNASDLFWASRGGGGRNFGIATSFRFRTHPLPPLALFTLEFPWGAAGELVPAWMEWVRHAPDELWSNCLLLSAGASGLIARTTGVYVGGTAPLSGLVARLVRAVGTQPTSSFVGPETYLRAMLVEAGCAEITLAQCHLAAPGTAGTLQRSAFDAKSAFFARVPPARGVRAILDAIEACASELPQIGGGLAFDSYGGAINAVPAGATAFVHREALCQLQVTASWGSGASARTVAAVRSWLADTGRAVAPYTNGQAYQNYIDPTLADWRRAYYGSNLSRLEAVKRRYDPDDVFSFAQSIPVGGRGR